MFIAEMNFVRARHPFRIRGALHSLLVKIWRRGAKADFPPPQINSAKPICGGRCSAIFFRELTAAPIICGGLIGISPRVFGGRLHVRVGDFVPEGGFFVLLEGDLLIIHEKVLSTDKIVGW